MSAAVEADRCLKGDLGGDVAGRNCSGIALECIVEVGHINLVVFAVVQLHDLLRDTGLKSLEESVIVRARAGPQGPYIVGVWQRRKTVCCDRHDVCEAA